jgi:hypothetical protein
MSPLVLRTQSCVWTTLEANWKPPHFLAGNNFPGFDVIEPTCNAQHCEQEKHTIKQYMHPPL